MPSVGNITYRDNNVNILLAALASTLSVTAIILNSLLIYVICRAKYLHTCTNCFLVSLSVAELLVAVFAVPWAAVARIHHSWAFSNTFCTVSGFLYNVGRNGAAYSLVMVCLDRCVAVSTPLLALLLEQVCVADIKVQTGEATLLNFQQQFGRDRVFFVKCDVTSEEDVKAAVQATRERFGKLTIMVNNAGMSSEAEWSKMVDVNLKGVIVGTQEAVAAMRRDAGGQGGVVVNIASAAGLIPVHTTPVYAATKFGVVGFTRSWAANPHLPSLGISFSCICPTFTDTDMIVHDDSRKGRSLYSEDSQRVMAEVGVMPVSQVVSAFEQLLDSPDNNGVVMAVTNIKGVRIRRHGRPSRL